MSARVGVVGCGIIAKAYVEGSVAFDSFEIVACADLEAELATAFAEIHRLQVATVDALIADPSIDVVLNLTAGMGGDLVLGGDESPLPLDASGTDMVGATERLAHVEELLPAFLRQRRKHHADLFAITLRIDAEVGFFQRANDILQRAGIKWLD